MSIQIDQQVTTLTVQRELILPIKTGIPTIPESQGSLIYSQSPAGVYVSNGLTFIQVGGAQGYQGYQGFGAQGLQGFQGPSGGAQGAQGGQGAQGPSGGPQGAQGAQGSSGGAQGAQGAQGATGFQGSQGTAGTGSQGSQGSPGNTGSQGSQGQAGSGSQGAQGSPGLTGLQGFQGQNGQTGGQGLQGFQGLQGPQGSQGLQGPQGAPAGITSLNAGTGAATITGGANISVTGTAPALTIATTGTQAPTAWTTVNTTGNPQVTTGNAWYTQIGKTVTFTFKFSNFTNSGGGNTAQTYSTNLPFPTNSSGTLNTTQQRNIGYVDFTDTTATATAHCIVSILAVTGTPNETLLTFTIDPLSTSISGYQSTFVITHVYSCPSVWTYTYDSV
jgi:hypothetical protein